MQRIYLDNAATTPLDPMVLEAMMPYFTTHFGNPSSIYSFGRESRMAIEKSRKYIANFLHASPGEIFFTSCGTESSNTAISSAVRDLGCKHIITSAIEHHATLHTCTFLETQGLCTVSYVALLGNGEIDMQNLDQILQSSTDKCLVTLMHGNNEISNLTDIQQVGEMCKKHDAIFHTDAVQTMAHYPIDLSDLHIHFLSASGHKFHGPKGNGFLYINQDIQIKPFIHGGSQERMMRAGTENVAGIVGLAKAMELALTNVEQDHAYILSLKQSLLQQIQQQFPSCKINGNYQVDQSLYTQLNVAFPNNERTDMLSINLDMAGICVSGGSACNSGAQGGSHVIKAVYPTANIIPIRFSFSKLNTSAEIDVVVEKIKGLL